MSMIIHLAFKQSHSSPS